MNSTPAIDLGNPLLLSRQLCFPLYAASRLVTRLYQPLLTPLGLTYPQYVVLLILWEKSPCSVSRIGALALLNSNTLTPLLKRLEGLGYVTRTRGTNDERVVNIQLTATGIDLKSRCMCFPQMLAAGVNFPPEKAAALKQLLTELMDRLRGSTAK